MKTTQVITFPVEPIDFPYYNPLPFEEVDIQNNLDPTEYSEPVTLNNGQNNYNPDYIHISSYVSSPFPDLASITSGSVIHLTPGAQIEPKIRLNIGNPFQELYSHPPVSESFVSSFCNNQIPGLTYQANQFSARAAKLPPISSEILNRYLNETIPNSVSIHPNPANSQIRITSSSKPISEIQIFDLSGRSLIQKQTGNDIQQVEMNIDQLQSGVYIVQTLCGDERNSEKLVVSK